jgi:hypothetical protein
MYRSRRRAVSVFLLALALAMPVAALPEADPDRPTGLFTAFWDRLASLLGTFEASWSGILQGGDNPDSSALDASRPPEGDSRSSMDPNGNS